MEIDQKSIFNMNERRLSVIVLALFASWMLAFSFQGRVLYEIANYFQYDLSELVFLSIASHFVGLIFWGLLIKTKKQRKSSCYIL